MRDGVTGGLALILPIHLACEREPAVLDAHLNAAGGHPSVGGERLNGQLRKFFVLRLRAAGQSDFDLADDRLHATDARGRGFGCDLLGMGGDVAGERHDPIVGGNSDRLGVQARLTGEFVLHVAPQTRGRGFSGSGSHSDRGGAIGIPAGRWPSQCRT